MLIWSADFSCKAWACDSRLQTQQQASTAYSNGVGWDDGRWDRAGQGRSGQGRAEQDRTGQGRSGQGRAGQGREQRQATGSEGSSRLAKHVRA